MEILVFHLQLLQNSLLWEFSENSKFWLFRKIKMKNNFARTVGGI